LERCKFFGATQAAAKRKDTFLIVGVSRWVSHLQRTVFAATVLQLDLSARVAKLGVARLAEVVRAEAVEKGDRTAILALPVDVLRPMLRTVFLACAERLEQARLTLYVFFLDLLSLGKGKLLLTVDQTPKEGLVAGGARIKGALMEGELERLLKIEIACSL